MERVRKGLAEGMVAVRLGFWGINNRPGLLVLFLFPLFIIGPVSFTMTRVLGLAGDSLIFANVFFLTALVTYAPVMAAAILESDALGRGGFLTHGQALRQGLRNLRFLFVPLVVTWFGIRAINHLLVFIVPLSTWGSTTPEQTLAILSVVPKVVLVALLVLGLYLACRLLIALPDRVLSEEEPPKMWPAVAVLAFEGARVAAGGTVEGLGGPGPEVDALGVTSTWVVFGAGAGLILLFLLALKGRIPAGLRWSWVASRDLDILLASLVVVVVLALIYPLTWIYLSGLAGWDGLAGVLLYFLALTLVAAAFGQWALGRLLAAGLAPLLFVVRPLVPFVDPFRVAAFWVVPLALLAMSAAALYARATEAE